MSKLAIETFGLSKRYQDVLAVDDLHLRVRRGEIYAFLGLNGAGKSTTIRMLLGMIKPTSGRVELFGERIDASTTAFWSRVGHLVEGPAAYPELTVRENLEVARSLQGLRDPGSVERIIVQLGLEEYALRKARTLSMGNAQRLGLARAMLHRPDLLILDEPTNALDPAGVVEIRELIQRLAREQDVTIFLSSHILAEVDRLATRIGIVHQGRLIEELDSEALERQRDRRLEVDAVDLSAAETALQASGFAPSLRGRLLELREPRAIEHPEEVATALVAAGTAPRRLAVTQEDLEQHFLRLTQADGGSR